MHKMNFINKRYQPSDNQLINSVMCFQNCLNKYLVSSNDRIKLRNSILNELETVSYSIRNDNLAFLFLFYLCLYANPNT